MSGPLGRVRRLPASVAEVVLSNVPTESVDALAGELFGVARRPGETDAELVDRVAGLVVREESDEP